ncbi:MAG: Ger(x)C family spore germination C-terminal domain-containing protein [Clostridiales bacterium]|nr:Ger(x)C family spore germination C-terminal domain-containing protein [Clostridiales bacterium]
MKRILSLLLLTALLLFAGCSRYGPEEQLLCVVLGVDLAENGQIVLTVKSPTYAEKNASSDPSGASGRYMTLAAQGDSLPEMLVLLRAASPRTLSYAQTRAILVSQQALRAHPELLDELDKTAGMRVQAAMIVCRESVGSIIRDLEPDIGTRLSRSLDATLQSSSRKGIIPYTSLHAARSLSQDPGQDALLILAATAQDVALPASSGQAMDGLAGQLPEKTSEQIDYMGAAALDGRTLSGFLTGFETSLCRFLQGGIVSIFLETSGGYVSLTHRRPARLSLSGPLDAPALCLNVSLNASPVMGANVTPAMIETAFQEAAGALMTHLRRIRCDALGFGALAARRFARLEDWQLFDWKAVYEKHTDVEITVRVAQTEP